MKPISFQKFKASLVACFVTLSGLYAQNTPVDLELSLVVDSSPSISNAEFALMMEGYARVFENATFLDTITSGTNGAISVNLILFTASQSEAIAWRRIGSPQDATAMANLIRTIGRLGDGGTGIGDAINVASQGIISNNFTSENLVLSISGDGLTNQGVEAATARDAALVRGVDTLHGIVVGDAVGGPVETHFTDQVIGGDRPFLCRAASFEEFEKAILFKLTSVVQQVNGTCLVSPTTIALQESAYVIDEGATLIAPVSIHPVPIGGLYSQGFRVIVESADGNLAGVIAPTPTSKLSFDGILALDGARVEAVPPGSASLKGSANFFDRQKPTETAAEIAEVSFADLPAGSYTVSIDFWNQLGPTEDIFVTGCCVALDPVLTFGSATIEVVPRTPTLVTEGPITVEPQTGLLEQKLTFKNEGTQPIRGFRIYVDGLPDDVKLWNGHGFENGIPYVDIFATIPAGESLTVVLEFQRISRQTDFTPTFRLERTDLPPGPVPGGGSDGLRIIEIINNGVLVEFPTEAGRDYTIEFSDDMKTWTKSQPSVQGTGERIQWMDSGPPKTTSYPTASRFYRLTPSAR